MTDLGVYCFEACSAGAPLARSDMFAAVSSNAVEKRLVGLAQPEEIVVEHTK